MLSGVPVTHLGMRRVGRLCLRACVHVGPLCARAPTCASVPLWPLQLSEAVRRARLPPRQYDELDASESLRQSLQTALQKHVHVYTRDRPVVVCLRLCTAALPRTYHRKGAVSA